MEWIEVLALVVASLFFLVGLVGSIVPVLPGAPLIWAGMLIYAFIVGFEDFNWLFFSIQGVLALLVMGVDYMTSALGSRYFGGTKAATWGSMLGLFIGIFFFPIGLLIGPFLGAMLLELIFTRKFDQALRSGLGATIGFLGGLPVKLIIEIFMIIWFFIRIL